MTSERASECVCMWLEETARKAWGEVPQVFECACVKDLAISASLRFSCLSPLSLRSVHV